MGDVSSNVTEGLTKKTIEKRESMDNQVAFKIELAPSDVDAFVHQLLEKFSLNLPDLFIPGGFDKIREGQEASALSNELIRGWVVDKLFSTIEATYREYLSERLKFSCAT